jgi:hypothetical protein
MGKAQKNLELLKVHENLKVQVTGSTTSHDKLLSTILSQLYYILLFCHKKLHLLLQKYCHEITRDKLLFYFSHENTS